MNTQNSINEIPKYDQSTKVQQYKVNVEKAQKKIAQKVEIDVLERVKEKPEYTPTIAEKTIINVIEQANKKLQGIQTEFEFGIHEKTKQIMVKVIDKETKEIVREIPPEKTLDMVAKMWELAGILIDEKR